MAETVFEIRGLHFTYGPLDVLTDLSLDIQPGRFYGIVGPNGCGKTTLLDLMVGSREPNSGELLFMGQALGSYTRANLARTLALAPQEFAINFPFTVQETVMMGRHPHIPRFASPSPGDLQAVDSALTCMDALHLAGKLVTELSGGEKQRVVLARTLAQETPVILLDEPTSNLDVNHSMAVLGEVESRVRDGGRTVVTVMHDLNLAAAFCDQLIFVHQGKVHAAGPTAEVLSTANLEEVFGVQAKVVFDDYAGCPTVTFRKQKQQGQAGGAV